MKNNLTIYEIKEQILEDIEYCQNTYDYLEKSYTLYGTNVSVDQWLELTGCAADLSSASERLNRYIEMLKENKFSEDSLDGECKNQIDLVKINQFDPIPLIKEFVEDTALFRSKRYHKYTETVNLSSK